MQKPKRNKPYRKRDALPFGGLVVIAKQVIAAEDQQPIIAEDQTDLGIAYWTAFEQMTQGASSEESWSTVTCSLNIALILSERGLGDEYEPYIIKALDGAFRATLRAKKHGVWRFDGEAINDIRLAFEVHDQQITLATKEELRDALSEVHKRISKNHTYQEAA